MSTCPDRLTGALLFAGLTLGTIAFLIASSESGESISTGRRDVLNKGGVAALPWPKPTRVRALCRGFVGARSGFLDPSKEALPLGCLLCHGSLLCRNLKSPEKGLFGSRSPHGLMLLAPVSMCFQVLSWRSLLVVSLHHCFPRNDCYHCSGCRPLLSHLQMTRPS